MVKRYVVVCAIGILLAGASVEASEKMTGESLVLAGETPGKLLVEGIEAQTVEVRSTYLPGGIVYERDRDYRVDPKAGTISRTVRSRIPDFATNVLYGKKEFDHNRFPGYGNGKFFVYVDYAFERPLKLASRRDVSTLLRGTIEKLRSGKPLKVIAFGDSITAGYDVSEESLQYPARYVKYLKNLFPNAAITLENTATAGDTTVKGLAKLDDKLLSRRPHLVLVAFGMNDHNRGGVAAKDFKANLKRIVNEIRDKTKADVILVSTCPPNPDWHLSSHNMEAYARATSEAADECRVAYADVYSVWQVVLARKDYPSLLGNNINHPNDFGHWLYLQALEALELK
jgi:acyl-CoA thioesterase I